MRLSRGWMSKEYSRKICKPFVCKDSPRYAGARVSSSGIPSYASFTFTKVYCAKLWQGLKNHISLRKMKRRQGEEEPERYLFVVDTLLKNHEFSLEEVNFLRQLRRFRDQNHVGCVTWNLDSWGVSQPVGRNYVDYMQEKAIPLIAADWRTQF